MKIFIMAYLRNNLGDDLFVIETIKRYPEVQFFIEVIDYKYAKAFEDYKNVEIVKCEDETFEKIDINKYDGFIYVGGSIFMEGGKVYNLDKTCVEFIKKCKETGKPFFYISSNYGPYSTQEYFKLSREAFKNCTDLCFRDKYSASLFSDIKNVRYAPDLLFSNEVVEEKEKNDIGISVIDLSIRNEFKQKEKEYIAFLTKNINLYLEQGKDVYLFSFCEAEGDSNTIKKILNIFEGNAKYKKLHSVIYDGDAKNFMKQYKKMEYMICQRFHSLILSYINKQKFYVVSYSNKINNIIKDLNLCDKYLNLKDINGDEIIPLKDFYEANPQQLEKLQKEALEQYRELDKFLK